MCTCMYSCMYCTVHVYMHVYMYCMYVLFVQSWRCWCYVSSSIIIIVNQASIHHCHCALCKCWLLFPLSHLVAKMKWVFDQVMILDGNRRLRGDIIQKTLKVCIIWEPINFCLECPIPKLRYAFSSLWKELSNDVFWSELYDWSKSIKIEKPQGYSLAFFLPFR